MKEMFNSTNIILLIWKIVCVFKKSLKNISNFGRNTNYSSKYCFTGKMPGTVENCRGLKQKLSYLQRLKKE